MAVTEEAIVLAGGLGTRLRNVVRDLPKPLAPVAGRPFLAWLLDNLSTQGIRRVILATGYGAQLVESTLGARWHSMELVYSREQEPKGTGGAVAMATSHLHGTECFVLNGDTSLRFDYAQFAADVRETGAKLGVALSAVADASRYGAVSVERNRIVGFIEKGLPGPGLVNAGAYWMDRSLIAHFPQEPHFSFEARVLAPLVSLKAVVSFVDTAEFIDIGVPEDYVRAQMLFANTPVAR